MLLRGFVFVLGTVLATAGVAFAVLSVQRRYRGTAAVRATGVFHGFLLAVAGIAAAVAAFTDQQTTRHLLVASGVIIAVDAVMRNIIVRQILVRRSREE